jgi:Ca2+-binding EF-hand superfamily protein
MTCRSPGKSFHFYLFLFFRNPSAQNALELLFKRQMFTQDRESENLMRKLLISSIATGLALALFASPSFAQDGDKPERKGERPSREDMMKKFDKDGDGQLNEAERKAAREAMQRRRGGAKGKRGDGKRGGKDGKGRRRGPSRADILKKFDKDGDGKLNEAEQKAAREHMKKQREKRFEEMFKKADKDGNGKISADEAKALGARGKRLMQADKDGDGAVSKDELKAAHKARGKRRGGKDGKGRRGGKDGKDGKGRRGRPDGKPEGDRKPI